MSLIAGLRERRDRGLLAQELSSERTRTHALDEVARTLLDCVRALVLELEDLDASAVQARLDSLRGRLHAGDAADHLVSELEATRTAAFAFAEAEREYLARRDAELRRIITVLSEGIAAISANAAAHHQAVLDTGARFEAASRLADLVKVRASITSEVQSLRTVVAAQQSQDAEASAALRAEVDRLRGKVEVATRQARLDPLTHAANRAAFDEELARHCAAAAGGGPVFSLLMIDIDHFKAINDTHGHPVGDRVLNALVSFLRDRVREGDLIARWGGEEFAVLLAGAPLRGAFESARRLVKTLAASRWAIDTGRPATEGVERLAGRDLTFTISIGVTVWQPGDAPAAVVERADAALYAAKRGGRNRAVRG